MRRNSFNHRVVNPTYILFGIALLYGVLSPMFYYASPLLGLAFYYLSIHFEDEDYYLENLFIFIYITIIEIDRGLFLFSFLLFFLISYNLSKAVKESIICKWCVQVIFVIFGYAGYYLTNIFLSNIFNFESISLDWNYLIFILTDIFLVFVLL